MKKLAILISLAVLGFSSCSTDVFVKSGKSEYKIIVSDVGILSQHRAAVILQEYIEKMSGASLPIVANDTDQDKAFIISVDSSLEPDEFTVSREADKVVITGGEHKGCIYAVVHLLEKEWGCKKFSPSFEIVPNKSKLDLPSGTFSDKPVNTYRIINGRFCNDTNYQDWQALDLIADQFADKYYVHTFNRLVPWEENFLKHPEYYSEVDGRRIKDQLCLTNEKVYELAVEKLREEMQQQPDKKLWSVSQNDNFTYCQCEDCQVITEREKSPAGPVIHFVNRIAREFPDKIISTLAYQYSRKAPENIKPEKNVQIVLCTIELNRSKAIAEDPSSKSFLKDIVDWGKIADNIYLWDYTVNFSHHITPFPNIHVLQPNIQLFTDNNVYSHFQQSNTDVGHEFSELKSYLISHLLWNPEINVDSLIEDFTNGYYGEAASLMREYLFSLQADVIETGEWLDIYGHPTAHENTFMAEDKVSEYLDLFIQARTVVQDDSARLVHVREAQLPLQYAAMEIGKNHMFDSRGWYSLENDEYVPRKEMVDMLEDFIATCRLAGVRTVNEAGLKPEDYYSATNRFIDVQVEGNLAFRKAISADPMPSGKYSKGDISYLCNGVQGASDYKVHWLGWEAQDFSIVLDLGELQKVNSINLGSLYDPKSWIFHPESVQCSVSKDGSVYKVIDKISVEGDQKKETVTRSYNFVCSEAVRFVKMEIMGTMENPFWHPSAGGKSWVFIDELVVR